MVFSQLATNPQNEVYYYLTSKNHEVDFVLKRKNKVEQLIQVCHELSSAKTEEREERALWEVMDELKLDSGIILNKEIEKVVKKEGKKIYYIPLWKWLLKTE